MGFRVARPTFGSCFTLFHLQLHLAHSANCHSADLPFHTSPPPLLLPVFPLQFKNQDVAQNLLTPRLSVLECNLICKVARSSSPEIVIPQLNRCEFGFQTMVPITHCGFLVRLPTMFLLERVGHQPPTPGCDRAMEGAVQLVSIPPVSVPWSQPQSGAWSSGRARESASTPKRCCRRLVPTCRSGSWP